MLDAFVATFLEGLETFLVVAAALAFFRKSRRGVVPAVQLGLGVSVVASVMAAWLLSSADNPQRWVWLLAVAAAVFVVLFACDVWNAWRGLAGPRGQLEEADPSPRGLTWLAVFVGSIVLVARNGMFTVLLFASLIFHVGALGVTVAALSGTLAAALMSWLWSRYSRRLPARAVVSVTAGIVLIFLAHLLISDILGLWQSRRWPLL